MASRLVVHIGPRKTGTTYLQRVLQLLSPDLAGDGLLYPTTYRGRDDYNHVGAVTDLTHADETKNLTRWSGRDGSDWSALTAAVARYDGTVLISAENLGGLRPTAARALLDGLGVHDVHVVITMRDLGRILPSSWQQHIRNTHTQPYKAYLRRRARERGTGVPAHMQEAWDSDRSQVFWRSYAYGALVRRWQRLVGSDAVTVVTLPPPGAGSSLLWSRFRDAVDPERLPEIAPALPAFVANVGSTEAEAYLLRAFNVEAKRQGWKRRTTNEMQQRLLATGLLDRPDRGRPLGLPYRMLPTVQGWAQTDIADIHTTGARVVGTTDDLIVPDSAATRGRPQAEEIAAAGAFAAVHSLQREVEWNRMQLERARQLTLRARLRRRLDRLTSRSRAGS